MVIASRRLGISRSWASHSKKKKRASILCLYKKAHIIKCSNAINSSENIRNN